MIDFLDWAAKFAPNKPVPNMKKFTQLVKNHHEAKFKKVSPLPCIAMEKLDGLCGLVVCYAGEIEIFSRTGRIFQNTEHLKHMIKLNAPYYTDYVVCVEVCNDELSLEELGGIFNPDRVKPVDWEAEGMNKFYLGCYDLLTYDEFVGGISFMPYRMRLSNLKRSAFARFMAVPAHIVAHDEGAIKAFYDDLMLNSAEGLVRCLPEAPWTAGSKNEVKTKMVCGVDYDLEVLDIERGKAGTKREGMMTNAVVRWRNTITGELTTIPVDGCFTDEQRITFHNDEDLIIGKIVHVHALKLGSKGSLRLPKVKAIRFDKMEADV